jgi:hypothetical protein
LQEIPPSVGSRSSRPVPAVDGERRASWEAKPLTYFSKKEAHSHALRMVLAQGARRGGVK